MRFRFERANVAAIFVALAIIVICGCTTSSNSGTTDANTASSVASSSNASQGTVSGSPVVNASPSPQASPQSSASPQASASPLPSASPHASPQPPNAWNLYSGFTQSYTVPYAVNPQFGTSSLQMPSLRIQAYGSTLTAPMDTGSRGLRITQNLLPPGTVITGTPGQILLTSSNRLYKGIFTTTQVIFPDATAAGNAPMPATATFQVLIEQSVECVAGNAANQCSDPGTVTPTTGPNDPKEVFMGVGIDRPGPNNGTNNQNSLYNAFLNLDAMHSGTMVSGYILTPQGVLLGLTPTNTTPPASSGVSPYAYAKLTQTSFPNQPPGTPPDWQQAVGYVSENGTQSTIGSGIIDTGIGDFLTSLAGGFNTAGTNLQVSFYGVPGFGAGYNFLIGDASNPLAPSSVAVGDSSPGVTTFYNTGRNPLNAFNVLWDAANGFQGLQLNSVMKGGTAFLSPFLSTGGGTLLVPPGFSTDLPLYVSGNSTITATGSATFSGAITGTGTLTVNGGGSVVFNHGAYSGGPTSVTTGTSLKVNTPAVKSIAVPTVNYGTSVGSGPNTGVRVSFGGGPATLAQIDTGSDAVVVNESFAAKLQLTDQNGVALYNHCTVSRAGRVAFGSVSMLNAEGNPVLSSTRMPILVVKDGTVESQDNGPERAIIGLRMNGSDNISGGNGLFASVKYFLPSPFDQMVVLDRPNSTIYFGSFIPSDFSTVALPAVACNKPAGTTSNLGCWDDAALPFSYVIPGASGSQVINTLLDSGATQSSFQFQSTAPPSGLTFSTATASMQALSGAQLSIPLTTTVAAFGPTNCTGNMVDAGNNVFNFYQVLFDQVNGQIGLRPAALSQSYP